MAASLLTSAEGKARAETPSRPPSTQGSSTKDYIGSGSDTEPEPDSGSDGPREVAHRKSARLTGKTRTVIDLAEDTGSSSDDDPATGTGIASTAGQPQPAPAQQYNPHAGISATFDSDDYQLW
jgi:hypothetical protein